jgi:carbonic anhydrase
VGEGPHWGYTGESSPEHWGELSPEYQLCHTGLTQSPIDLSPAIAADVPDLTFSYQPMPLDLVNNGHTIQMTCAPGSQIKIEDQSFDLLQFHFHAPSEHTLNGRPYGMECHLVHRQRESGELAVVGVWFADGAANATLGQLWEHLPKRTGDHHTDSQVMINPQALIPLGNSYRYFGSLTTPPCSEIVRWVVFAQPLSVAADQVSAFLAAVPTNARPGQVRGRRFVLSGQ